MVEISWNPIRLRWGCISIRFTTSTIDPQQVSTVTSVSCLNCAACRCPWLNDLKIPKEWVERVKILHWEEYLLRSHGKVDEAFFSIYSIVRFYFSTLFGWFWGCYASAMAARQSQISVIDLPLPRSKRPPLNASVRPGCSMGRTIHPWSMGIYTWLGKWFERAIHIGSSAKTV
jgi:hypothetical protein